MWIKKYYIGGIEGYENNDTNDTIYVVNRHQWEVVLNSKNIKTFSNGEDATTFMEEHIKKEVN